MTTDLATDGGADARMRADLTWAEWLALMLVTVFILLPVLVWRWLVAVWLRWTGRWVRGERRLQK